jgi:hypothetical protein
LFHGDEIFNGQANQLHFFPEIPDGIQHVLPFGLELLLEVLYLFLGLLVTIPELLQFRSHLLNLCKRPFYAKREMALDICGTSPATVLFIESCPPLSTLEKKTPPAFILCVFFRGLSS